MDKTDFANIELLVLDVDGVLTDGSIVYLGRDEEIKAFNVRDGSGMKYWRRVGKKLALISGRESAAVVRRAEELGVDAVRLGAKDKLPAYQDVLAALGVSPSQTAVIGDDLTDLPMMVRCGFAVATADAAEEVRLRADHVTGAPGGGGCVREVIEMILKNTGLWDAVMARYLPAKGDTPR